MDQEINTNEKNGLSITKKIIILVMMLVVIGLLAFLLLFNSSSSNSKSKKKNNYTRTIMIYASPQNLEYELGIASADFESMFKEADIDLDNMNVLVYTGGTSYWRNSYISNKENALFELTKDGLKKIKSYDQYDMGDSSTLLSFLDYAYDNYKTDKYDLIIYGHGGAIWGTVFDDFNKDTHSHLELTDFQKALKDSKFNKNNKLELVIFRSCLNGTLEVASVFSDYADYLVFSEEISYGSPLYPVLGFINSVKKEDSAVDIAKRFINDYEDNMSAINIIYNYKYTYSLLDLSKTDDVISQTNAYFNNMDLDKYFKDIAKLRYDVYQYGFTGQSPDDASEPYNTVDLYNFVSKSKKYSSSDSKKLLKSLDEFIVYNVSNEKGSHGVSIYFPHRGDSSWVAHFLSSVYAKLDDFDGYKNFITKYASLRYSNANALALSNSINKSKGEYSYELTSDQLENFGEARYIVFEKDGDKFRPVISSNNYTLDNGKIQTKLSNSIIKITDKKDNSSVYLPITITKDGTMTIPVTVYNTKLENMSDWVLGGGSFNIFEKDGKLSYSIVLTQKDKQSKGMSGILLDDGDYTSITFPYSSYNILDAAGNYKENWDKNVTVTAFEVKSKEFTIEKTSLDANKEYYIVFKITDVYGNSSYTNLLKM